jgi:hypothetical protein
MSFPAPPVAPQPAQLAFQLGINEMDGNVVLLVNQPVTNISWTPENAIALALQIIQQAELSRARRRSALWTPPGAPV